MVLVPQQTSPGLSSQTNIPFPPQCGGSYLIFIPGTEPRKVRFVLPLDSRGQEHIASIADNVNELRLRPELAHRAHPPHEAGGLVPHQRFPTRLGKAITELRDELRPGKSA